MDLTYLRRFAGPFQLALALSVAIASTEPPPDKSRQIAEGKELFTRVWEPGDKRSFAGDGLGPVFNARSCAECHKQGGVGGAGPQELNAMFVTAFVQSFDSRHRTLFGMVANEAADQENPLKQPDRSKLAEIHPFLRTESSFPIHRLGRGQEFSKWQGKLLSEFGKTLSRNAHWDDQKDADTVIKVLASGARPIRMTKRIDGVNVALILSQRNTPPLFGVGVIDKIPDEVLKSIAAEQARKAIAERRDSGNSNSALPVSGRVARLKDGRIGRFGWKGTVATLREFTMQACSSELGLEIPGIPKSTPPWDSRYKSPGLDMTAEQCDALVEFVASLPAPRLLPRTRAEDADQLLRGKEIFTEIGCASCHRPDLGDAKEIYSDLLLHDMGQSLSDAGNYGTNPIFVQTKDQANPLPVSDPPEKLAEKESHPKFGAGALEWRTPPLWGLRDSGPYLHDGRAKDIDEAIGAHGGEGANAARAYAKLDLQEQEKIRKFLLALAAPSDGNVSIDKTRPILAPSARAK